MRITMLVVIIYTARKIYSSTRELEQLYTRGRPIWNIFDGVYTVAYARVMIYTVRVRVHLVRRNVQRKEETFDKKMNARVYKKASETM
jgi:hypothetical protein